MTRRTYKRTGKYAARKIRVQRRKELEAALLAFAQARDNTRRLMADLKSRISGQ
jgi:hypothetical protein